VRALCTVVAALAAAGCGSDCPDPSVRPSLICADPVTAACTGPMTAVSVPDARIRSGCRSTVGTVTNDVPASGFPVGDTTVTFRGDPALGMAQCTTTVTVTDMTPPTVNCPPSAVFVRPAPDAPVGALSVMGTDTCDSMVDVTLTGVPTDRGTATATATARDDGGNTAMCQLEVMVLDAFTVDGFRLANATLAADATTQVSFVWEPSEGLDATGYALQRADAAAGPFTTVMIVPAPMLIATDIVPGMRAYYRLVTMAGDQEGGATEPLEIHAVADDRYDVRGQTVPSVPFPTTLYAVVRHPVDLAGGPYPLILVIHGNHGICRAGPPIVDLCANSQDHECPDGRFRTTPNAEGYIYFMETLAAQGYIAASMSANALNCRDDFVPQRTQLVLEHIRRWNGWNMASAPPFDDKFVGRVDMSRVGVVGHSRGGEAVEAVPSALRVTPIAGVTVRSVFAIAPIDFHDPTVVGTPFAVLLPSCDGDVATLEGRDCYDRSVRPDEPVERAQILFSRANHNYFNSEWRNDDNEFFRACSTSEQAGTTAQRGMLETVLGSWMNGTLKEDPIEPFMRMESDTPQGIDAWARLDLDLRWSWSSAMRVPVDEFESAGAPATNLLGQPNTFNGYETVEACTGGVCGMFFPHAKSVVRLSWMGMTPIARIGLGSLATTGHTALSIRAVSRRSTFNMGLTEQDFAIRVTDGAGATAELLLSEIGRLPHLYVSSNPVEHLSTIRVPFSVLTEVNPAFDPATLSALELEMTTAGHTTGSIYITDVELAAD
jgi:hypothetical protein